MHIIDYFNNQFFAASPNTHLVGVFHFHNDATYILSLQILTRYPTSKAVRLTLSQDDS